MASLIDYKGLDVLSPDPTGAGGLAIQNDLKILADRMAASRYASGLQISFLNASTVSIAPGNAMSADGALNIHVFTALSPSLTASGANGLDVGALTSNQTYFVHVIADSSDSPQPVASLLSLSETPALPQGYDKFRRIGFVVTDASGDILRFQQVWDGLTRRYYYAENRDRLLALTDGHAASFTPVNLAPWVPATAQAIKLTVAFTNNAPNGAASDRAAFIRAEGDVHNGTLNTLSSGVGSSFPSVIQWDIACSSNQQIEYRVSNPAAALTIAVAAVDDQI